MRTVKKPHYAWIVCLTGALSLSVVMGLGANVFTLYQPEILAFHGFTNAQGSWITTTRSLFVLLALLSVNALCARLSLRVVMTLGNLLMGLSCFSFALSDTFPMYCVSAAVLGVGYCYGGMVPLSLLIANWFRDRRGLALGIAAAGSGVSTVLVPPVLVALLGRCGLHTTFFIEGIFVLCCTGLIWLLLRSRPEELGLEPYSDSRRSPPVQTQTAARTVHSPGAQRLVLFAALLLGGPVGPCFTHLAVYYTSEGFDSELVALFISMTGLAICLGKILCGQVYDRLGGRWGNHFTLGLFLLGLILCCLAPTGQVLIAAAALFLFSVGLSVTAVSPAVWAQDLSGGDNYAGLVRAFTTAYTAGMLLFGPIPGLIADWTGSYQPAYVLFTGALLVAYLIVQGVYYRLGLGRN